MTQEKKGGVDPHKEAGVTAENPANKDGRPFETAVPEGAGQAERGSAELQPGAEAEEWAREKEELICLVQRKQADLDNFRRISRMKEEETRAYGLLKFLEKLLPVLDNLERALLTACEDEDVPESYLKGLVMIQKQLQQLLEQEGVAGIEALGKPFDPHYHDAVMQTDEGEGEPGSVVGEFEKGYLYKDRVLRHAKVKVMQS